jgi:hypothetical protein
MATGRPVNTRVFTNTLMTEAQDETEKQVCKPVPNQFNVSRALPSPKGRCNLNVNGGQDRLIRWFGWP